MFHKLLFIGSLCAAVNVHAQVRDNPTSKTTEKPNYTQMDYKKVGAPMPPFRLVPWNRDSLMLTTTEKHNKRSRKDLMTSPVTNRELDNGANLFIMIFNPTCSHCEDETALLEKNISLFNKSKLVLMATPVMQPYIHDFVKTMHVEDYPSIIVGIDSAGFLDKLFMYQTLPQINIYDHDRKLLKIYNGEAPIDSLKQYIE